MRHAKIETVVKKILLFTLLIVIKTFVLAQDVKLTDFLLYPRLDSTFWEKDYNDLNSNYSKIANRCQTCIYRQTDTTRSRFCVNTTLGQIQLDTALHNFSTEKLIGKWNVINFGKFEITDSVLSDSKLYYRKSKIISERKENNGYITFTEKRLQTSLIDNKEIPNKRKRYRIVNRKYLTTKSITGYCGATIIGMTQEGYLIIDDHTFRTLAKWGKYMTVKTTIRRMILKKSTTA
jgi:hypothetical protein